MSRGRALTIPTGRANCLGFNAVFFTRSFAARSSIGAQWILHLCNREIRYKNGAKSDNLNK